MKILMKETVAKLGEIGDEVVVANGYARNYLLPQGKAVLSSPKTLNLIAKLKKEKEKIILKEMQDAELFAKKLEGVSVTISRKVGENDKLFGSVTLQDIVENLKEQEIAVTKKMISLEHPLKALGVYKLPVKVHKDVVTELKIFVVKEDEEKESE